MVRVVVEIEGGLVHLGGVVSDTPGVEVYVLDRDIEGGNVGTWPGVQQVKAVGGLHTAEVGPARLSALLGEIAQECDYCEGTGKEIAEGDPQGLVDTCEDCEGRGWWLPYAEAPTSADPGCACGLADRGAPGHEEEPGPQPAPALRFGADEYHHECGGVFVLRVEASFFGTVFNPGGYSYDELDRHADEEASLACDPCGFEVDFGTWQEAAQDETSEAWKLIA